MQVAMPNRPKYKPAFMVEKLEGTIERQLFNFDSKGKRVEKIVTVDAGYKVTFMKGHSIRVLTKDDLTRLGYDRTIPLMDENGYDDDIGGAIPNNIAA